MVAPPTGIGPIEIDRLIVGLRRRLDAAGHPQMIETLPGRGYRFSAAPA